MTRAFDIEALVIALERAKDYAVLLDLGEHFISDLKHLITTVNALKEEE